MRRTPEGLWYRPADKVIVDEVRVIYDPIPVRPDDVLLDLGAHIGATSHMVLRKGAKQAIAVEADPENVRMLRRNVPKATIIWAAVAASSGHVPFYVRRDRSYLGSLMPDEGRSRILVQMVPFASLLAKYRPTIVKCDIEFGEWSLQPELRALPDQVRVLAMEIHIRYAGIFAREQPVDSITRHRRDAVGLIGAIEAQGFREVRRKDKQAKPVFPPAPDDDTGLNPMTKAVDAVWVR